MAIRQQQQKDEFIILSFLKHICIILILCSSVDFMAVFIEYRNVYIVNSIFDFITCVGFRVEELYDSQLVSYRIVKDW